MKLKIPDQLTDLIKTGIWPTVNRNLQELSPILGKRAAHKLSPEDDRIILMPPPFHTISEELLGGNDFWETGVTNPDEIDYSKALIIADFGLGSDSPIILDYGSDEEPTVRYLRWAGNGTEIQHSWVETHKTFAEFAADVELI